jgi:Sulfotransferase family
MAHLLRYSGVVHGSITRANPQHNFAHTHAVHIYDNDAVYTMIPKNGCTSLRVSIAIKNGMIQNESQWGWIHNNNDSFRPSLRELATAKYRFTILRCPYSRLVSCFLDKILKRTPDAWQFHAMAGGGFSLEKLTFRSFCKELAKPQVRMANIHWRPQIDFLVYADYDDVFCFEDFGVIAPRLEQKIGLKLVDARSIAKHDSSHYKTLPVEKSFADTELWQIESIMMSGLRPDARSLFDSELKNLVAATYAQDFKLYRQHFADHGLFDRPLPAANAAAIA